MRSPAGTTQAEFSRKLIMTTFIAKRFVLAAALVAATVGAHAAGPSGARDPYTDGAHSVAGARDPYTDGARSVGDPRDPYTDGARSVGDTRDRRLDGARALAGMDRAGVSSEPAHRVDPFLDGAYA